MNTRACAEGAEGVDDSAGGPALAARRGELDSLRGPEGGYARSHRGLAAFWRVIAEEILVRPAPPETLSLLTQLDDWLAGGPACALVESADPGARTALLARWALSIVERKAAEVIFVPVSPCFGTAVERDMLKLFFGLFRSSTTAVFRASVLTGSEQQLVQRWAADACAGRGEVFPRPIPHVTTDQSAADPERVRRIRAGAKHEEVDGYSREIW
ncbi:hypothetical protein WMF37_47395 [Sorangium sp. So ce291]|uniref:hypothetical protein n=1 Tax=Sorangium sp. So ce291 TaxID=3133294 RepID=UPI003F5E1084